MTVRTKFMSIGRLVAAVVQIFESQAFHIPWNKSLSNSKVTQEHVAEGLWEIGGDQPLQSRIQGFHYWDGQYRNLRVPRDFFEETMSRLHFTLGNWWSHVAHVENACSLQKEIDSWTKTDVTHCLFLSRKTNSEVLGKVNQCVKWYITKRVICYEKPNFLSDGTHIQTVKSRSLTKVGQKRKLLKNTTHLPWKTILMKLHLQEGRRQRNWKIIFNQRSRRKNETAIWLSWSEARVSPTVQRTCWWKCRRRKWVDPVMTDFGQSNFGQNWCFVFWPFLANDILPILFCDVLFCVVVCVCYVVCSPHPTPTPLPPDPPSSGPPSGPPKISLFFSPLPHHFCSFCLSLGVFSLNFGGFGEDRGPQMCTFGLLGCRVKPRRLRGRRGFTREPENSKRAHLTHPKLQTPPKFHEKTPRQRQKERKWGGRGKKKSAKFWAPHPSGPPPFGAGQIVKPLKHWFGQHWFGQEWIGQKRSQSSIHPAKQTKAKFSTTVWRTRGVKTVHPRTGWKYFTSTSSSSSSRVARR